MSLQATIVPGRLRSELCSWGVNNCPRIKKCVGEKNSRLDTVFIAQFTARNN